MNHMWAQEAHSLGQHLLNQCPGSIWQCLCSWDPWGLSSERQRGWRRITQQLMVSSCLKINISQTKLPIIIHESQSVIFPVPDGGNPALPAAQAKTLDFSDFFHTLHPILQEILSLLPSKSIKNPTTSLYLYVATLLQILNISLLDCFNSLSALAPILPPLKSARELPWKWNQIMTNICQKTFQRLSLSLIAKLWVLTVADTVWPWFLSDSPLLLSPCSLYSWWMSSTQETHSHLRAFAGPLSTTGNVLPPYISKAHSLTSFMSQIWHMTFSPRPSQASQFKTATFPNPEFFIASSFLMQFFLIIGSRSTYL